MKSIYGEFSEQDIRTLSSAIDPVNCCTECKEHIKFVGTLNNIGQCSECSVICETCGISQHREPIVNGQCKKCSN